jgi:hypothetical protein
LETSKIVQAQYENAEVAASSVTRSVTVPSLAAVR